jgi:hypothetical protein
MISKNNEAGEKCTIKTYIISDSDNKNKECSHIPST